MKIAIGRPGPDDKVIIYEGRVDIFIDPAVAEFVDGQRLVATITADQPILALEPQQ